MLKELPEEEFGPRIDIREYSILDNPSLPSEVNRCDLIKIKNNEFFFLVIYLTMLMLYLCS
jgi:hypothetical protein